MTVFGERVSLAICFFVAWVISEILLLRKSLNSKIKGQEQIGARISRLKGACDCSSRYLCYMGIFFRQKVNSLKECLNKMMVGSLSVMREFFFRDSGDKIAFSVVKAKALIIDV